MPDTAKPENVKPQWPSRLLLFGATGDLAARSLFPALAALMDAGRLPGDFAVLGSGSRDISQAEFRAQVERALDEHADDASEEARRRVLDFTAYGRADIADAAAVAALVADLPGDGPLVAYLALPPAAFTSALQGLASAGLPEGSRLIVEKPFGEDLASARELNALIHEHFDERSVFRVDHFLAKQTVHNVLGLRFANRLFEPLWSNVHVERVEITFDETLALEGRARYYDGTGALVDMIQNHLLQLLCLVALDPPHSLEGEDLRDRKLSVLRSVRAEPDNSRRARYTKGRVGDDDVPSYVDEEGVDPVLETETFASVTLAVESWRWSGVPFVLRSGKALSSDRQEIAVWFKPVPHLPFGQVAEPHANVVRLELGPDRLSVALSMNADSDLFDVTSLDLTADLSKPALPAYANVLVHAFDGDPGFSVRADEAEEAWRVVEPILQAWRSGRVPMEEYPAGSDGPEGDAPGRRTG